MIVGGRYRINQVLGKGGVGAVYEAHDLSEGRFVALKRLLVAQERHRDRLHALFQREYHTLSRLEHPAVIQVYDYGVDEVGPYYTMELLPGEDLRGAVPLPFEAACGLLHDVISSLCLLHTRHLIHRDITPRNIRMVGDGHAKLFDFGALAQMGHTGATVGTPPFVPPEALYSQPLDGRSDLYSFGVVLYHALTGRLPYPGRNWDQVQAAWSARVPAVAELVPEVPEGLDRLTMSLIALDRAARPRDASEVLERLASFSANRHSEAPRVARAYLMQPELVAREAELERVREAIERADRGHGHGLLITGPSGVGRSRMLDAAALQSRVVGAVVLRGDASAGDGGAFAAAQSLAEQLCATFPDIAEQASRNSWPACRALLANTSPASSELPTTLRIAELAESSFGRAETIGALRAWFDAVSERCCLVLTMDDLSELDEPSVAWLATQLQHASSRRLLLLGTLDDETLAGAEGAWRSVVDLCSELRLSAFDENDTTLLFQTLFGAVPHLHTLARRAFTLCEGRPRELMALCEHLVDTQAIRYQSGSWLLPTELDHAALPESMAVALDESLARLSHDARMLALALASSTDLSLTRVDFAELCPQMGTSAVQNLLDELLQQRIVVTDGYHYRLSQESWREPLVDGAADADRTRMRFALAGLSRLARTDPMACVYQLLLAHEDEAALNLLQPLLKRFRKNRLELVEHTRLPSRQLGELFVLALRAAERLQYPKHEQGRLAFFQMMLGIFVDTAWFEELRPRVVAELAHDSGLTLWQELGDEPDPMARVVAALQKAQARYDATDRATRGWSPEQAVRSLAQFCAAAIAVGAQTAEWELRRSLPALLEPFACLSPVIDAMLQNSIAVCELGGAQYVAFRDRSLRLLERLGAPELAAMEHVEEIREAITFGVAASEARMGLLCALPRLESLEGNPRLRGNTMELRAHLHLLCGDWTEAARCKQLVERYNLEARTGQMFGTGEGLRDLEVYAWGGDLGSVKYLLDRIGKLARKHGGWLPTHDVARGQHALLRGDPHAALEAFDGCLARVQSMGSEYGPHPDWHPAVAGKVAALVALARGGEALEVGRAALAQPGVYDADGAPRVQFHPIVRELALAEARTGAHGAAREHLCAAIAERERLGTAGMQLGALHEALAQVGIWSGEPTLYAEAFAATEQAYGPRETSAFGWRLGRLEEAARRRWPSDEPVVVPGSDALDDDRSPDSGSDTHDVPTRVR